VRRGVACLFLFAVAACSGSDHPTANDPDGAARDGSASSSEIVAPPIASLSASVAPQLPEPPGELDVDALTFDFAKNPELTNRIAETPHSYFRFIGSPFRRAVCKAFATDLASAPRVRLHGDPHAEQYAVTDLGRWLMDFDDAAVGPPVIDLVRMSTSLILATRQLGGEPADADHALSELLRGYTDGLAGKRPPKEAPAFAKPLVAKLSTDHRAFLDHVEQSMELPLSPEAEANAREELADYVALLAKAGTKKPASFFEVKRVGAQKLGIGSALTTRYLFRLEGPSKSPDDDVVIEVKGISDLTGAPCVTGIPDGVVVERAASQKRARLETKLLPPMLLSDRHYWASEWLSNYFEVRVKKLRGVADLTALAYEAGEMLAVEHMKPLPDSASGPAPTTLELAPPEREKIAAVSLALADESEKGWRRFKSEATGGRGASRK